MVNHLKTEREKLEESRRLFNSDKLSYEKFLEKLKLEVAYAEEAVKQKIEHKIMLENRIQE